MLIWLRSRERPGEVERLAFPKAFVTVGRRPAPDVDLVIYAIQIARHHCRFEAGEGWLAVHDLGAPNNMYINGRRAPPRTELRAGDQVYFHSGHTLTAEDDRLSPAERAEAVRQAFDPSTPGETLRRLGRLVVPEVAAGVAGNPNAPPEVLLELAARFYAEVQANPVVGLLALERPAFLDELRARAGSGRRLP